MKHYDLEKIAEHLMEKRGLQPHFSKRALEQLDQIYHPASPPKDCQDLRSLLFCSIDNEDSRDLDQLTFAAEQDGKFYLYVAIADVDALVPKNSPLDQHAQINTTSVYTPAKIFPLFPNKLSTDFTSLNEGQNRLALVVKITMNAKGFLEEGAVFQAMVHNHAKLSYPSVGQWLEGKTPTPEKVARVPGLESALLLQHKAAQILKDRLHTTGALTLELPEAEAKIAKSHEIILEPPSHNFAEQLIEGFMIAANSVIALHLERAKIPSLRRVVRVPQRWDRLVQIAASLGTRLPSHPESQALEQFLIQRKKADPQTFADLSLTVIKLLGRGEYVVEMPGVEPIGHFGLGLREYTHATAPNRRYPDLITQRQHKALIFSLQNPYSLEELKALAQHCTEQEGAAVKVQRYLNKSAAAMHLASEIGAVYSGIVTGASSKGTWARVFNPPVEGRIIRGFEKLDVGDRVVLRLVGVDVLKGYIDFIKLH